MSNPVLHKLRSRHLSARQLADLLEKHIGDGLNSLHCLAALDAIDQIREYEMKSLANLIRELQTLNDKSACEVVWQIIAVLRAHAEREGGQ